jgi:hypothetical protein
MVFFDVFKRSKPQGEAPGVADAQQEPAPHADVRDPPALSESARELLAEMARDPKGELVNAGLIGPIGMSPYRLFLITPRGAAVAGAQRPLRA